MTPIQIVGPFRSGAWLAFTPWGVLSADSLVVLAHQIDRARRDAMTLPPPPRTR